MLERQFRRLIPPYRGTPPVGRMRRFRLVLVAPFAWIVVHKPTLTPTADSLEKAGNELLKMLREAQMPPPPPIEDTIPVGFAVVFMGEGGEGEPPVYLALSRRGWIIVQGSQVKAPPGVPPAMISRLLQLLRNRAATELAA